MVLEEIVQLCQCSFAYAKHRSDLYVYLSIYIYAHWAHMHHFLSVRECPIIRSDLCWPTHPLIRTFTTKNMYTLELLFKRLIILETLYQQMHQKINDKDKDLKKSWIKTVFLGVCIFSSLENLNTWFPEIHPPTQIRTLFGTLFGFVNPYELLDAP